MVRKAKIVKKPKFDLTKLMELYKDRPADEKPEKAADADAEVQAQNALTAAQ